MECPELTRPSSSSAPPTTSWSYSASLASKRFWSPTPEPSRPNYQITTSKRKRAEEEDDEDEEYMPIKHTRSTKTDKIKRAHKPVSKSAKDVPPKPIDDENSTSVLSHLGNKETHSVPKVKNVSSIQFGETDSSRDKIEKLGKLISNLQKEKEKSDSEYRKEEEGWKEKLRVSKNFMIELEDKLRAITESNATYVEKDKLLQTKIAKLKTEAEGVKAKHEQLQKESGNEKNKLRVKFQEAETQCEELKVENQALKAKNHQLQMEINGFKANGYDLTNKLREENKVISDGKDKRISELQAKISRLHSVNNKLRSLCKYLLKMAGDILTHNRGVAEERHLVQEQGKRELEKLRQKKVALEVGNAGEGSCMDEERGFKNVMEEEHHRIDNMWNKKNNQFLKLLWEAKSTFDSVYHRKA